MLEFYNYNYIKNLYHSHIQTKKIDYKLIENLHLEN